VWGLISQINYESPDSSQSECMATQQSLNSKDHDACDTIGLNVKRPTAVI